VWPPPDAEVVELDGVYERLAGLGYVYGPVFQGLRAVWRRGEELFAEVEPPDGAGDWPGPHPALLDAALHPLALAGDGVRLPFSWSGVQAHGTATGPLRVAIVPAGDGQVALSLAGSSGEPVLSVAALTVREADLAALAPTAGGGLYRVAWSPANGASAPGSYVVLRSAGEAQEHIRAADVTEDVVLAVPDGEQAGFTQVTADVLAVIQAWLAADPPDVRLAVVTRHAVAVRDGEPLTGLAQSALWGLVRSAQTEHPGRFVLIDTDGGAESERAVGAALATGEPQLALRDGLALVPRLVPVRDAAGRLDAAATGDGATAPDEHTGIAPLRHRMRPEGTVLITGATGSLGR
ncbi:SpnB-like Rossmann fold domain-containing protein, partial [Sphaerisporangium rubeum]